MESRSRLRGLTSMSDFLEISEQARPAVKVGEFSQKQYGNRVLLGCEGFLLRYFSHCCSEYWNHVPCSTYRRQMHGTAPIASDRSFLLFLSHWMSVWKSTLDNEGPSPQRCCFNRERILFFASIWGHCLLDLSYMTFVITILVLSSWPRWFICLQTFLLFADSILLGMCEFFNFITSRTFTGPKSKNLHSGASACGL